MSWRAAPPRVRLEHAVIDVVATRPRVADRYRVLADVVQTRQTSAAAIADTLRGRPRVAGRRLLFDLLDDLAKGACSVLEREYLLLERRHGLPSRPADGVQRQEPGRVRGASVRRDVSYRELGLRVELDGRAFHDSAGARDRDASRDLAAALESGAITIRLTWSLVLGDGCRTIAAIAALLQQRGWRGPFLRCPSCP